VAVSKRASNHLTIVEPKTVLEWQRRFIKNRWTYPKKKPRRKPVSKSIKELILEMKQDNQLWGCIRISDELKKLGIYIHYTTVNKIMQTFRKNGQIQPVGSWKRFLKMHWDSLFSMDFIIIDTLFGKRLHLLVIMQLKTRKIVAWEITEFPSREFVRQRIILFTEEFTENPVLIHDNASVFTSIDYSDYGIKGVNTCMGSPNMNAYVERFNGSIRREVLDHYLLISQKQVKEIIGEYIEYYNNYRMYQGIGNTPVSSKIQDSGQIKKNSVLGGLHHYCAIRFLETGRISAMG
jgi:putative transposase